MKAINRILKNFELNIRSFFPLGFIQQSEILFFPGCSLISADPELVKKIYKYLKTIDNSIGLWSACCGRPLVQFFDKEIGKKFQSKLIRKSIFKSKITVITACGNCFTEFNEMSNDSIEFSVISLYDILSDRFWEISQKKYYKIHHPCPARREEKFLNSFNKLIKNSDIKYDLESMNNHNLSCCLINTNSALKKIEKNKDNLFLTYCAHCVKQFQSKIDTIHILQLLFDNNKKWKKKGLFKQLYNVKKLKKIN